MLQPFVGFLIAIVATLFGAPTAAAASAHTHLEFLHVHTYNADIHHAPGNYTAAERGPLVAAYNHATSHAVALGSHGLSAYSDGATPSAATTCDAPTGLVQVARAARTTRTGGRAEARRSARVVSSRGGQSTMSLGPCDLVRCLPRTYLSMSSFGTGTP
jgi:hypothetical protein